jgi:hypothetical protein
MSVEFSIKVSLQVFKHLTSLLEEGQTHDDVIRDLLEVDSIVEIEGGKPDLNFVAHDVIQDEMNRIAYGRDAGFASRGLWLPNETQLRARYKQRKYRAIIKNGCWLDDNGQAHSSPSAAASAITGNNVNGLRFWEGQRPGEKGWRRLDVLAIVRDK